MITLSIMRLCDLKLVKKILSISIAVLIICSCSSPSTRSKPINTNPKLLNINENLIQKKIAIIYFDASKTIIEGDHYEGIYQVKQYDIFGLNIEQKKIIYNNLVSVSIISLILELKRQGLNITVFNDFNEVDSSKFDFIISGKVNKVKVNTYGSGFKGIGSAGNYWDSEVIFTEIKILKSSITFNFEKISYYAKIIPSPVKLDLSCIDFFSIFGASLTFSYKYFPKYTFKTMVFAVEMINQPLPAKIYSSTEFFFNYVNEVNEDIKKEINMGTLKDMRINYKVEDFRETPTEVASRNIAVTLIRIIEELK